MARLTTLSLPIAWESLGLPTTPVFGGVTLIDGPVGWGWEPEAPELPIAVVEPVTGTSVEGWGVDHVVVLIDSVDETVETMADIGLTPRLKMEVRGRPAVFFRAGPVIEAITSPVRQSALYGVALVTDEPLETVALRWRSMGHDVGDPGPAIQPGRRILTVRGMEAGLAVMSPDRQLADGG
ncbi:MAG: hypothetical protein KJP12_01355 [Acidimicrobiia bacterium]|nr:hypothetical protein [Acidimicrobiia bacterium]MBT8213838.1 hypothetical protein [Acidimicrobiia bacterium]NNF70309.1 hypothetical protein [Acidimicrobiia bacterium]